MIVSGVEIFFLLLRRVLSCTLVVRAPPGLAKVDASIEGAMPDEVDGDELWLIRVPPEVAKRTTMTAPLMPLPSLLATVFSRTA